MSSSSDQTAAAVHAIAWISRGRLFVQQPGREARQIESPFAQQALQREMRDTELNAWKGRSGVWGSLGIEPPGAAPWEEQNSRRQIFVRTIARAAKPTELFYVLDMGTVGGLFRYDLEHDIESRLVHRQGFVLSALSRHPADGRLAVALPHSSGTIGLSITRDDGLFGRTITLSDSIDDAPEWLPDGSERLVFHSSAFLRNDQGMALGNSAYRIEMLDLESEEAKTLHEEDGFDLLQPRVADDDCLMFIRRPYRSRNLHTPATFRDTALDVVLFPFRLARTFVYFFNFMSMMFAGKPLITAGGPGRQNPAAGNPYLMLWGQAVDTRRALSQQKGKGERVPIAPKDWELIRRDRTGSETVVAGNVLCWDLARDGSVFWSDGRSIYRRLEDGSTETVADGDVIERVVVL